MKMGMGMFTEGSGKAPKRPAKLEDAKATPNVEALKAHEKKLAEGIKEKPSAAPPVKDLHTILDTLVEISGFGVVSRNGQNYTGALHFHKLSAWNRVLHFTPLQDIKYLEGYRLDGQVQGRLSARGGWFRWDFLGMGEVGLLPGSEAIQKLLIPERIHFIHWDLTIYQKDGRLSFLMKELSRI